MARRRGKGRFESEEEDPMAGTSNLVDAMLVKNRRSRSWKR